VAGVSAINRFLKNCVVCTRRVDAKKTNSVVTVPDLPQFSGLVSLASLASHRSYRTISERQRSKVINFTDPQIDWFTQDRPYTAAHLSTALNRLLINYSSFPSRLTLAVQQVLRLAVRSTL
jgi:hypothetical protein